MKNATAAEKPDKISSSDKKVPRKTPRQQRSKATVDAILQATARVLVSEGWAKTTTNRVAAVAGVSVGSLYQYFPGKEALIVALMQRHCEQMITLLTEVIQAPLDVDLPTSVRRFVRAMLDAHAVDPRLHQVFTTEVLHLCTDQLHAVQKQSEMMVLAGLQARADQIRPKNLEMAAFVLSAAIDAVTHQAVLQLPDSLKDQSLEDEVCDLVLRYLVADS